MKISTNLVLSVSLAALLLAGCQQAADEPAEAKTEEVKWGYDGAGAPANWGALSVEYATCKTGTQQSPINLPSAETAKTINVTTNYAAAPAEVVNNGHTIQANIGDGFMLSSGGTDYKLLQFHMHTPSEHTIDGKALPMVAHFVHATAEGKLAVLGILFKEGEANAQIQSLIDKVGGKTELDLAAMLPAKLDVVNYQGSLTTPPCSEGVNWHVVLEPVTASAEQIKALKDVMHDNARPVQPLGDRAL